MKKLLALLLALTMVFSLVACGGGGQTGGTDDTPQTEQPAESEAPPAEEPQEEPGETSEEPDTSGVDTSIIPEYVKISDSKVLEGKNIGCTIVYKGDEWCYALSVALETLGKIYGANIVVEDGDLNDETQTKQIENMVASNVDIIFADPTTPDGTHEALMKAVEADIPIIIYDGYWNAGDEHAVTTVTWDQEATGLMIGEYFVNYIKEHSDGKAKVVELTNAVSTHCQERFVGLHKIFDQAREEGCEIEVLGRYDTQGNRELAYNAVAAIVEPYDYIISDVDNGAFGAVSALRAAGNTDVKVFCMGAYGEEPFTTLYNNDPNYTACLNVDPWVLAQFIYDSAISHFEGKEVPKLINIDLHVVDSNNVKEFWDFE